LISSRWAAIAANNIEVLNVAGTRWSKGPEVVKLVKRVLEEAFFPRVEAMVVQDS
jgi:hypothetical protein